MSTGADCAVVGLGIMGSMTLLALARRGVACVGYDSRAPGHPDGASGGGETRIFRSAGPDGPAHDDLLARSRELWQDLAGPFTPCGALTVGPADDPRVAALCSLRRPEIEVLDHVAARDRWPAHRIAAGERAVLDRSGGMLAAAGSVRAALAEAARLGARIRSGTTVTSVSRTGRGAVLRTADGEQDVVHGLVLATGRWTEHHDPAFAGRLDARRVVLTWFDVPVPDAFGPAAFPPGVRTGPRTFTFFPTRDARTIKINMQMPQPVVRDPRLCHPPVDAGYSEPWASALPELLAGVGAAPRRTESYVEAYTRRRGGAVRQAQHERGVRSVVLGGFSGQGFKYAPALGEIAASYVVAGTAPAVRPPGRSGSAARRRRRR